MIETASLLLPSVMLIGLESVGKSALFRELTGQATGDELNFRGSTVVARTAPLIGQAAQVVDPPGIRAAADSDTTQTLAQYHIAGFYLYDVLTNPVSSRFWPKMGFQPLLATYKTMKIPNARSN